MDERVARSVALEQAYVHDVYEQYYDNPRSRPWPKIQHFLEELEAGSLVCDVGCGNGKYLNINTSIFNIGGEKSTRLGELVRDKENEVIGLDNLALPFKDESLDAALSIAVVHHFATTERRICALRELARVLRIGGRLIISVWAMEQTQRKFESQDVLVPWRRPKHLSTPSLELTSTTTNTSEDDGFLHYHAYTQTSDSDSNRSFKTRGVQRKKGKNKRGRSIDPGRNSSPSSSSLSSPNETCYSFVRRAIQKLAGGRRVGVHKPWFLDSWTTCANKEQSRKRNNPEGCDCCDCMENVQDLPIELRRIDDDEIPQRRKTFPSSQLANDISNLKSKSMTNIKTAENNVEKDDSNPSDVDNDKNNEQKSPNITPKSTLTKPKLVKQKKSINEDDADEALDQPTDMKNLMNGMPDFKTFNGKYSSRAGVFKQRSLNEEILSTDRLQEKEKLRRNIQKQTSLNEELIYQRTHTFDSIKDSFFSVSTSKKFQLIKTGLTNKIKNSTTNMEKVAGNSLKNGVVRIFQNWKNSELTTPLSENDATDAKHTADDKKETTNTTERRPSKEDGSDSSKDSSLQSDTSVDSEDSFASVIFVPKSDPMSPAALSPCPTSPLLKNSPRIKQQSCPSSPRIKQTPLAVYPLTKQLSSPKPSTEAGRIEKEAAAEATVNKELCRTLAQKYHVQQIPEFKKTSMNTPGINSGVVAATSPEKFPAEAPDTRNERLKKIRELLSQKPGFGRKATKSSFPIVRQSNITNGKVEAVAKPLPRLLTLELFNPETDDKDSDSSCVSSPDSVDSVISVKTDQKSPSPSKTRFKFPPRIEVKNHVEMGRSQEKFVKPIVKAKRKLPTGDLLNILQKKYTLDTTPLLANEPSWEEDCHKHLAQFADKLSEKLLQEIDQKGRSCGADDPYIHRLSEELDDLSMLSAEIQKQNEYLEKLSASDGLLGGRCAKCKNYECQCFRTKVKTKIGRDKGECLKCDNEGEGPTTKAPMRKGNSSDSCDSSDRGSSTNSMISSGATSINFGPSVDSTDGYSESRKDTASRCSDASTASLASCPDWRAAAARRDERPSSGGGGSADGGPRPSPSPQRPIRSDASQDSLPTDDVGGEITYHRYYHVFREGELDQLIERHVENLHVISSYYDHASWCIVAEKVQVWTI